MCGSDNADLLVHVEPLIKPLRHYLRGLLRDVDLADDLLQDCLERVISRWGERRSVEDTRKWVFAIAHNLALNAIRERTRKALHIDLEEADEDSLLQPAQQEHRVRYDELLRALEELPHDQLAALLLVSVEDHSYAEAADALHVPIGTVMSRLARARQRLQRALDGGLARRTRAPGLIA